MKKPTATALKRQSARLTKAVTTLGLPPQTLSLLEVTPQFVEWLVAERAHLRQQVRILETKHLLNSSTVAVYEEWLRKQDKK